MVRSGQYGDLLVVMHGRGQRRGHATAAPFSRSTYASRDSAVMNPRLPIFTLVRCPCLTSSYKVVRPMLPSAAHESSMGTRSRCRGFVCCMCVRFRSSPVTATVLRSSPENGRQTCPTHAPVARQSCWGTPVVDRSTIEARRLQNYRLVST